MRTTIQSTEFPNKGASKELLDHAIAFMKELKNSNINFVVYGSLACVFYREIKLDQILCNDVDLLVSEKDFDKVVEILRDRESTCFEVTEENSITILVDSHQIEIDSYEFYLKGLTVGIVGCNIDNMRVNILERKSLIETYKRAIDYIPHKAERYKQVIKQISIP